MIKYIFVDLDGTFLDSNKQVSKDCVQFIKDLKKQYDVHFGIASGRALTSLLPLVEKQELDEIIDVIVANNGAKILDWESKKIINLPYVKKEEIQIILNTFQNLKGLTICFHNKNKLFASRTTERILGIQRFNNEEYLSNPLKNNSYLSTPRVMLILDKPVDEEYVKKIRTVSFEGLTSCRSENDVYEFMNKETSKANGIKQYVTQRDSSLDEVMVFGDSDNDIEMLKECKLGIAMKNARPMIQNVSDDITYKTNDEEGVMDYLLHHTDLFERVIEG